MEFETSNIGICIRGVDLRTASPSEMSIVKQKLYQHRAIIVKDQQIDEAGFCDVSRRFGEPVPYLQENYHHPEYPLIFVSSNVVRDGKKMGVARTGGYWHSDTSFQGTPINHAIGQNIQPKIRCSVSGSPSM